MTQQIDQVIALLRETARQVGPCHTRAWWPAIATVARSRVGGNKSHGSGPVLAPGDQASMREYVAFVGDCNELRVHVANLLLRPVGPVKLTEYDSPAIVEARLVEVIDRLRVYGVRQRHDGVDQERLDQVVFIARRLTLRQEAILSSPRVPVSIPCKNAGERDLCTGWATNQKRRLCRSCENHEQYKQIRRRERNRVRAS